MAGNLDQFPCSWIRIRIHSKIRIHESKLNVDPDSQHRLQV
jgi:hypothetical protein